MKKEKLIEAKQGALMSLVDAMRELELEKVKGFRKRKDEEPVMEAEMEEIKDENLKKKIKEKLEDEDED